MPQLEEVGFDPFKAKATPEDFAARYGAAAEKAGKALGVDPAILLGQWGLETGWGRSVIPGTNNLGNIKDFSGSGVAATDNMTGSRDKYRQYESPDAFADDFVSLIQRKYPGAVGAGADPSKFTAGLKGYAEDPRYADKVAQATRMASSRKGPVTQTLERVADAVIPSAQAATLEPASAPQLEAVDFDPFAKTDAKTEPKKGRSIGGRVLSAAAGALSPIGVIADTMTGGEFSKNAMAGLVRGAGSIGSTLIAPYDIAEDAINGKGLSLESNRERRRGIDEGLQTLVGADPNSLAYQGGKLVGEIAGTAGAGPALGLGAKAAGASPAVVNALSTGGMTLGGPKASTAMQGAKNLLLRSAGGAATGAATAGLVNPEDAGTGAMIGGSLPVVTKTLGAAGSKLGSALRGPEAPEGIRNAARAAREAGYVIPPTQVKPSLGNRLMEGAAGKLTTAQNASAKNQAVTNRLARQTVGLADDAPITTEALDAIRAEAGKAYQDISKLGRIDAVGAKLPDDVPVKKFTDAFMTNRTEVDASSLIKSWKQANHDATGYYRAYARDANPETLAKAKAAAANAKKIDEFLAKKLEDMGQHKLLNALKEARVRIAKTYSVENALNPVTGNVDAKKLAKEVAKGKKLTEGLKSAADFAAAFPKAAQPIEGMGSLPQLSPLDYAVGTLGASSAGIPGTIGLVARPAARATILSPVVQNRLLLGGAAISPDARNLLLSPVYRSSPLLASDR